jgi:hypothetical protein
MVPRRHGIEKTDVIGTSVRIFRVPGREFLQSAVHYPDAVKSGCRFTAEGPGNFRRVFSAARWEKREQLPR